MKALIMYEIKNQTKIQNLKKSIQNQKLNLGNINRKKSRTINY